MDCSPAANVTWYLDQSQDAQHCELKGKLRMKDTKLCLDVRGHSFIVNHGTLQLYQCLPDDDDQILQVQDRGEGVVLEWMNRENGTFYVDLQDGNIQRGSMQIWYRGAHHQSNQIFKVG